MESAETLKTVMYVSRRRSAGAAGAADVDEIVAASRIRNQAMAVTGALIASQSKFAQLIEGPPDSIDALMDSILRDARHSDVKIVPVAQDGTRKFAGWALAYSGDEYYVNGHIKRMLAPLSPHIAAESAAQLLTLMVEFSKRLPGEAPG